MANKIKKDKKIKREEKKEKEADISEMIKPVVETFKKIDKSYFIMAGIVIVLALLIWGGVVYSKNINKFTYNGIPFEKTAYGKLTFYTAQIPVINSEGKIISYTAVDFRSDPRKLKNIPVSTGSEITFIRDKKVYISYDLNINPCENNTLAATNLGKFLNIFSLNKQVAVNDPAYLNNKDIPFANCTTNPANTVIFVRSGNRTEITKTGSNCYEVISKDCDIIASTEKFQLQILEEYLSNFQVVKN